MKDDIKGRRIEIMDGKHKGKIATFKSWAGTVVHVDIDGQGRMSLCLDRTVKLIS